MGTINSEKFVRICEGVGRDRAAILSGRGILSEEAALLRAVYWRLCKAGVAQGKSVEDCDEAQMLSAYRHLVGSILTQNAHPPFDGAPHLKELVRRSVDKSRGEPRDTLGIIPVASV